MLSQRTKFVGPLIQCFNSDVKRELEIFELVCIEVDRDGVIVDVSPGDTVSESSDTNTVHLARGQFFIPGFIDLHFHAPQFPQAGTKMSVPLSEWLATTTLPLEAKYADPIFAQTVFDRVVAQTLKHGTTTAVYFATKHQKAALTLAQCCMDKGQRALVGKVCMDNKEMCMCISNCLCTEETSESIQETRVFLESMVSLTTASNGRVKPVVTPRFVPSCSPQLLDSLGELTQEFKVHVQSHAWESDWQVDYGLQNRDGGRDLGLFRNHGLISEEGTILAHAVHATEDEIVELAKSKIGIAHCPLSNAFFANGIMSVRKMLDAGVVVGLGTDVGGAWTPSILDSARQAVTSSRMLRDGVGKLRGGKPCPHPAEISHIDAFWLATIGGGLALKKKIGHLSPGYKFDALVIDVQTSDSNIQLFDELDSSLEELFQKFFYLGDDRNILHVYVDGKCVLRK